MVLIPPGEFEMGSSEGVREQLLASYFTDDGFLERLAGEVAHPVRLRQPFYLGVHEVTQGQYQQVMESNPTGESRADAPVERVSWYDAVEFCNRLSEREGLEPYYAIDGDNARVAGVAGYRLPTEAQWEYACRAGTRGLWYFGDQDSELVDHAWLDSNAQAKTNEVGRKLANPYGLHDVYGNVWEWCWDGYARDYYGKSPQADPFGPSQAGVRVVRGGSWNYDARYCRSASRSANGARLRYHSVGFRVLAAVH